jgi:hypothetical protein
LRQPFGVREITVTIQKGLEDDEIPNDPLSLSSEIFLYRAVAAHLGGGSWPHKISSFPQSWFTNADFEKGRLSCRVQTTAVPSCGGKMIMSPLSKVEMSS